MGKASCKKCADVTKEIEQQCLRPLFGVLRIRQDYQTNNPDERPSHLPIRIGRGDGEKWHDVETIVVPVEDIPIALILPISPPPRILTGEETSNLSLWWHTDEKELDAFREKYGAWPNHSRVHPLMYFRLLAKIAHAFAIGAEGYGSFEPLLIGLINGEEDTSSLLIGCDPAPAPMGKGFFTLRVDHYRVNKIEYVGVNVCLFKDLGAPEYIVVVGKRPPKQLLRRREDHGLRG